MLNASCRLRYRAFVAATRNDRSEAILHAAMLLFHERGFGSVGVDLIGERAGISGPAIYRYFSGKDEILVTLLDEAIDRVLMITGGKFDNPLDELAHLVRGHVTRVLEEPKLMSLWTKERNSVPKQYGQRLRSRINRYVDRWADVLDGCYPGHSRPTLVASVHAAHGLIDSTVFWPRSSLKVGGLEDMLTAMTMASLEWLGQNASTPASQKRPRKAATKRTS